MDKLTPEELVLYKETFKLFDTDGNGSIDINELETMLTKHHKTEISRAELERLMREIDTNQDGTIDFKEFIYLVTRLDANVDGVDPEIEIRKAFDHFDKDKNGTIELVELKELLQNLGIEANDEAVRDVVNLIDENKDGVIDFFEFRKAYIELSLQGKMKVNESERKGAKTTGCCVIA